MNAAFEPLAATEDLSAERSPITRLVEIGTLGAVVAVAVGSYFVISLGASPQRTLSPPLAATLLVLNLVAVTAVMVLVARRVAIRRGAAVSASGRARLHVRLVAMFSLIAAIPTILSVIFASLLFQYGVEFWFSDRARGMLENASLLARENYNQELQRVRAETLAMSGDLARFLQDSAADDPRFSGFFIRQLYVRNLSEAMIIDQGGPQNPVAVVNPYNRDLENVFTPAIMARLRAGKGPIVEQRGDRIATFAPIASGPDNYIYAARVYDPQMTAQLRRIDAIVRDYHSLLTRSHSLQLRFNAMLLLASLLVVGMAIVIAFTVAERLVRPVRELADAARQVTAGDLSARVETPPSADEIGALARAFNQMTGQLEVQRGALVTANEQLDSRRALIEAVMSGVSAGVVAVDGDRVIRVINRSAAGLLRTDGEAPIGRPLVQVAPELDQLLDGDATNAIAQVAGDGEPRTLAVKIVRTEAGPILTFDDITQQQLDQRRAAWADVARRIAHEIKNPLTPIQLAAERLQRRYGKTVAPDDTVFSQLTETIVRQVGDLRRMVDEFSSFARMPKPIFRDESLGEMVRQAVFLHEVAHPEISFTLHAPDPAPHMVCDRRQIGQALTNIIKNGVEAIDARAGEGGRIDVIVEEEASFGGFAVVRVEDDGIGLPSQRDRIVEPYMTTRARGTGLGLAIVKKIVEEHAGTIDFADRSGGGTVVTLRFNLHQLAGLAGVHDPADGAGETDRAPVLTRTRTG